MKRISPVLLIFSLLLLLLVSAATSSARLLPPKQAGKEVKGHLIPAEASLLAEIKEDTSNLMGSEECEEKDEECQKRRMVAEAHLDYIYTQHHKQP